MLHHRALSWTKPICWTNYLYVCGFLLILWWSVFRPRKEFTLCRPWRQAYAGTGSRQSWRTWDLPPPRMSPGQYQLGQLGIFLSKGSGWLLQNQLDNKNLVLKAVETYKCSFVRQSCCVFSVLTSVCDSLCFILQCWKCYSNGLH